MTSNLTKLVEANFWGVTCLDGIMFRLDRRCRIIVLFDFLLLFGLGFGGLSIYAYSLKKRKFGLYVSFIQ
jgi:hypothetical protein